MSENIRFEILSVSPEMAELWLDGRDANRRIRMGHVRELVAEMKAGRWRITHQGIAFGPDGKLVDGQHRLSAVVMAETTVSMLVAYYEARPPLLQIDGIHPKSTTDRLVLSGRKDLTSAHVATTRAFWNGGWSGQASGGPVATDSAIEKILDHFWDAIAFGSGVMAARTRGVGSAIVAGALARAWLVEDHERLSALVGVLRSGTVADAIDDNAAIALREQLISSPNAVNGRFRRDAFLKTQRATKAFCNREPLKLIRAPEKDIYPLPAFDPYAPERAR